MHTLEIRFLPHIPRLSHRGRHTHLLSSYIGPHNWSAQRTDEEEGGVEGAGRVDGVDCVL